MLPEPFALYFKLVTTYKDGLWRKITGGTHVVLVVRMCIINYKCFRVFWSVMSKRMGVQLPEWYWTLHIVILVIHNVEGTYFKVDWFHRHRVDYIKLPSWTRIIQYSMKVWMFSNLYVSWYTFINFVNYYKLETWNLKKIVP